MVHFLPNHHASLKFRLRHASSRLLHGSRSTPHLLVRCSLICCSASLFAFLIASRFLSTSKSQSRPQSRPPLQFCITIHVRHPCTIDDVVTPVRFTSLLILLTDNCVLCTYSPLEAWLYDMQMHMMVFLGLRGRRGRRTMVWCGPPQRQYQWHQAKPSDSHPQ